MEKIDLRKQWKHLYAPSAKKAEIIDVPQFSFLMIEAQIEPDQTPSTSPGFAEAVGALYGAAYTLKFTAKLRKENPLDYPVMALEGLWWSEAGELDMASHEPWKYRLMIMEPEQISQDLFQEALRQLERKKPSPALSRLRMEIFHEGLCVQIMHVGPYAEEPATIERMHAFARENSYRLRGQHHEIYLGDPRRAKPELLKTILRHPIEKANLSRF